MVVRCGRWDAAVNARRTTRIDRATRPQREGPRAAVHSSRAGAESLKLAARADRNESFDWVMALSGPTADREEAIADLYALLLRGARFEFARRRASLTGVGRAEEA